MSCNPWVLHTELNSRAPAVVFREAVFCPEWSNEGLSIQLKSPQTMRSVTGLLLWVVTKHLLQFAKYSLRLMALLGAYRQTILTKQMSLNWQSKLSVLPSVFFFRSIGCVKSFVPLGSQNGLSGVDHLQSPKAWHPLC